MSTNSPGLNTAVGSSLELKNELHKSRSPYVRGHMNNPVAWQMWNEQSLALAKKYDRPLFVSIGYAACHWCHVMERESFESAEIAQFLNAHFIPIKIDREERPDIDRVYMNYVQASTGRGGWPMNVFLTPDLEPVFGGTYFPGPESDMVKAGATSFLELIKRIQMMWETQRDRCIMSAKSVTSQLREFAEAGNAKSAATDGDDSGLELDLLEEAYTHYAQKYDSQYGGFGTAPKFPTPAHLTFLLSLGAFPDEVQDVVGRAECEQAKQMALHTLRCMTRGGINDQIGNGFARYSVTRDWSLPHFEKMLYDQPQLLSLYLDAFLLTGDPEMLGTVYSIASYLTSPPLHAPVGGFYSSEDADSSTALDSSEKREGAFYVWTRSEIISIIGNERDADVISAFYNIHESGNVDPDHDVHGELSGQNVLAISATPEQLSRQFSITKDEVVKIIKDGKAKLLDYRSKNRPPPDLDDKIVAGWNGLAIGALARTSSVLDMIDPEKAKECKDAAIRAAEFLKRELFDPKTGAMKRVYREGPGDAPAFADDYAFMIQGLIELYEATFDDQYLEWADTLQKTQIRLFHDTRAGGFYCTADNSASTNSKSELQAKNPDDLILRLKDTTDGAEASTNGVSASNLYRLASFFEDASYATLASQTVKSCAPELEEHPFLFSSMLSSLVVGALAGGDGAVKGIATIVRVDSNGDKNAEGDGVDVDAAIRILRSRLKPNTTVVRLANSGTEIGSAGPKSKWLEGRNPLFKALREQFERTGNESKRGILQICEKGACRFVEKVEELVTEV